ncbi:hypothetical protein DAEQUDRAFT_740126 [Daedalea quercina L-15889]|uniref:Uncharacterized protein n=1 Tax=Daedalea quercina L-15889 TaxID=1314783 RepID=A0A165MXW0_9APHY|nr:hypothetical protein DAEQUDRAFT_740126 [Daedalea quercina L-15889]
MGPTFSPCPRPILKRPSTVPDVPSVPRERDEPTELLAIDRGILQPVVRFPARPALSKTFSAHSSTQYDRSPIVVQPNSCALPARGCPGRTYTLDDAASTFSPRQSSCRKRSPSRAGRHLHPRAASALPVAHHADEEDDDPTPRASPHAPLPALVPDLSSESDESDGFTSPPNELIVTGAHPPRSGKAGADSLAMGFAALHLSESEALAFLPHPPSSPRMYSSGNAHPPETDARAARHARTSNNEGSPTRKRHARTRSGASSEANARYKALSESSRLSGCSLADDLGCLDGF